MKTSMMYMKAKNNTMVQGLHFEASGDSGSIPCLAAKMAYKGGDFSAILAMPSGPSTVQNGQLLLENGLDYFEGLAACQSHILTTTDFHRNEGWRGTGRGGYAHIALHVPRFEVTFESSLVKELTKLGLQSIFKPGDLDKIADAKDLFVSEVKQKVYIKVDEQGTEAAAVTAVMVVRSAMVGGRIFEAEFDKPFYFSIVHNESGLALFSGTVWKPEKAM